MSYGFKTNKTKTKQYFFRLLDRARQVVYPCFQLLAVMSYLPQTLESKQAGALLTQYPQLLYLSCFQSKFWQKVQSCSPTKEVWVSCSQFVAQNCVQCVSPLCCFVVCPAVHDFPIILFDFLKISPAWFSCVVTLKFNLTQNFVEHLLLLSLVQPEVDAEVDADTVVKWLLLSSCAPCSGPLL